MAATQNTNDTQLLAGLDMTDWQYRPVKLSITADKTVIKADAASSADADKYGFILQNAPKKGEAALIAYSGRSLAVAGAAIVAGAELSIDAAGKLSTSPSTDAYVVARALEAAAAANEVVEVFVDRYWKKA